MDSRPIGIFDSGVGGLTVLAKIKEYLPNENIIYLGDTANFPYGDKSKEQIVEFSKENARRLIRKNVKVIIIACGTATSQALDELKDEFDIPIIGIITPTVKFIKENNMNRVGIIATEGTIKSNAWEENIKKEIEKIEVINKACPMLATIAEEGRALGEEGKQAIKEYMEPFKKEKIDKIVLGCTHYPIYEKLIKKELGYKVELINTGTTVAKYLKEYLEENQIQNLEKKKLETAYLTKPEETFIEIAKNVFNFEMKIKEYK